ncbi:MAG: DUF2793 domain-containing protein [Sphingomonadales bacterium]|nr:DUF2793 domain-containing protein [Sphingomonadales bacterium]
MSDAIVFADASPRLGLPMLFAGQAQKEFFVNEAHALIDALLHGAIEGEAASPPAAPADGQAWLVGEAAAGAWSGQAGRIAARQGGNWLFVTPRDGMRVLDRATGQELLFCGGWRRPTRPAAPAGGAVVDSEARVAITQLLAALCIAGIFPAG